MQILPLTDPRPKDFLVNVFPTLSYVPEWFPGAGWKRKAREWRIQQKNAVRDSYNWTKTRVVSCILVMLVPPSV
jgi:hypothetical protein